MNRARLGQKFNAAVSQRYKFDVITCGQPERGANLRWNGNSSLRR
ncbi:hypothetical protein V466_29890 [Pseudomonas mandelii PD30]|uniref:Uncharacterized protein n=1 Tax=Pseudomonas mandelii PD30 TaxID=1419583 RepID=A0A059KU38_9PSED|nr:hypothetical protein V466_29890 [Pseudomonas mandelii PD30]